LRGSSPLAYIPNSASELNFVEYTDDGRVVTVAEQPELWSKAYDPFAHGPNPAFGYLDIDVDADADTGGVLGGAASQRYLANVARFGRVPTGTLAGRAAVSNEDLDLNFQSAPQHERSGADFSLALCGCWETTVVLKEIGNANDVFEADESWIVRGRFIERTPGYEGASFMIGGSDLFRYDPLTDVRYKHSSFSNSTTITAVFPLDMIGAAMLLGGEVQEMDYCIGETLCGAGSNHFSIAEALSDVIDFLAFDDPDDQATETLVEGWENADPFEHLDPTTWRVTALFGMAYVDQEDAFYAWTDTGVIEKHGDVDGDGSAGESDETQVIAGVYALDGGEMDADGTINGVVTFGNPGIEYHLYDVDADDEIQMQDRYTYGDPADLTGDGNVDLLDFVQFQLLVHAGDPKADFNLDQKVDVFDFIAFQAAAAK